MITRERYFVAAGHPPRLPWLVRFPERLSQRIAHLRVNQLLHMLVHGAELVSVVAGFVLLALLARSLFAGWQRRRLAAGGTCLELRLPDRVERPALGGLCERLAAQLPRS